MGTLRIIAHIDMDAFYAAIEERENPQYKGLGVVVGADPKEGKGRGVVSTANYQARKYGIHSALPISTAWKLSQNAFKKGNPKTIFLPVNMEYYQEVSKKIFTLIKASIPIIEQTSVDEAYLDMSFLSEPQSDRVLSRALPLENPQGDPFSGSPKRVPPESMSVNDGFIQAKALILRILGQIREQEKLTAKVGIGPNKLVAKIASSLSKPDTVNIVYPQNVQLFLDPLEIRTIPGIGPKTEAKLNQKGYFRVGDLRRLSMMDLETWFGKKGIDIFNKCRGIDDAELETSREIKSISEQETFEVDTLNSEMLIGRLNALSEKVFERMKNDGVTGFRTVTITVRFSNFTTKSRSRSLSGTENELKILKNEAMKLFLPFIDSRENYQRQLIRLIGVGIENLQHSAPQNQ